jgi:hypothetical protein
MSGDIYPARLYTGPLQKEKCFMKQPIDKEIVNAVRQWAEEQVNGPISS